MARSHIPEAGKKESLGPGAFVAHVWHEEPVIQQARPKRISKISLRSRKSG
jgi:hypothetical protein